jgi:hypothetical protein
MRVRGARPQGPAPHWSSFGEVVSRRADRGESRSSGRSSIPWYTLRKPALQDASRYTPAVGQATVASRRNVQAALPSDQQRFRAYNPPSRSPVPPRRKGSPFRFATPMLAGPSAHQPRPTAERHLCSRLRKGDHRVPDLPDPHRPRDRTPLAAALSRDDIGPRSKRPSRPRRPVPDLQQICGGAIRISRKEPHPSPLAMPHLRPRVEERAQAPRLTLGRRLATGRRKRQNLVLPCGATRRAAAHFANRAMECEKVWLFARQRPISRSSTACGSAAVG